MSGCGTRIVLRGQKPLALCDRCPCFGSLFPPLAALTFAASSIICAFGLASAAPRSPYRHLELCGIALAAAAGTANIAVCRNVDENCWVIRDVVACIVSIGMAVDHENVFAAAFGANVGIFMGEAHSFLRYIVTDSCAAADQILEKAGECLKAIPHNSRLTA